MVQHYLDNSATTRVSEAAAKKAYDVMLENYANPSSLHSMGIRAEEELEHARNIISKALGADSREIIFTSGGTESNNLAVFGAAQAKKRTGNKIIATAVEHSSITETLRQLEKQGFEVIYLMPEENGSVSVESIEKAVDENTILLSIMAVNNETGAKMPVERIASILKRKKSRALLHIDAVQAFGKIPVNPVKWGADLLTVSSHKIHGPKGAGALYVRRGINLVPSVFGGEQERRIRPGTEPLPAIAGFAVAAEEININENLKKVRELNDYLSQRLFNIPEIVRNSSENALEYILNFSVCGIKSETMLHFLAQQGVYVSSGSACAKGKKSHVLTAMGLGTERVDSAIRISFSKYNTVSDAEALISGIRAGLQTLVRSKK